MDAGQTNGTAGRAQMFSLNAAYKRAYPEYYCEIDGVDILQNLSITQTRTMQMMWPTLQPEQPPGVCDMTTCIRLRFCRKMHYILAQT
ncbi:hypothetical protein CRX55_28875 [Raoultella planticola]|nr:hypothetical protein CRX55_28875 [Raoultella planticola]